MKTTFLLPIMCLLLAGLFSACNLVHNNDLELSVTESEKLYEFTAYFDENKTGEVQTYINQAVRPADIFSSADTKVDITAILDDKTTFHINSSPGKLKLSLNKEENTEAAYLRIKKIGEGVNSILTRQQ